MNISRRLFKITALVSLIVNGLVPIPFLSFADDIKKVEERKEDGLMGMWKFDEGKGTTLADSSGKENNGVFHGNVIWAKGISGGALEFKNEGTWVAIPSSDSLNLKRLTMSAWVYPESVGGIMSFSTGSGWTDERAVMHFYNDGTMNPKFIISDGKNYINFPAKTLLQLKKWTHIAVSFDGSTICIYLNGKLDASLKNETILPDTKNVLFKIGCVEGLAPNFFNGKIDEVSVYNRALTAEEVKILFEKYKDVVKEEPPANVPANVDDKARAELLENWTGGKSAELTSLLKAGNSAGFDLTLLQHMRTRQTPRFFFTPKEIPDRVAWIKAHLPEGMSGVMDHADAVLRRQFPRDDSLAAPYDVQLKEGFSWLSRGNGNQQTWHALNRHRFWVELAIAYRATGELRYADELKRQIVSWCQQHPYPPLDDSGKWPATWFLLDTAIRGDTWVWTYFLMFDTEAWTPEINTLFLHRLWLHERFLAPLTNRRGGINNWMVMQAQGMLNIAVMFPEFKESPKWEAHALESIVNSLNTQFRPDGGHIEQSPSYHIGCVQYFLEPLYLAKINGCSSAKEPIKKLYQAAEAFYQLLHPDGTTPALSDSDMVRDEGQLMAASVALQEPKWANLDYVTPHVVWLFGPMDNPKKGSEARPEAVALKDSGYYIMRSGNGQKDCQLIFDCGPKGAWHGHYDLLNFELFGFGKPLICDLGRHSYDDAKTREWQTSTPAHNTISVDGLNHAVYEKDHDPAFQVDAWEVQKDHVLVSAHHQGYSSLEGKPVVGRTIWYDRKNTFIVLDWGTSETIHDYTVSFTFPGRDVSPITDGKIRSQHAEGNVLVCNLPLPNQTTAREERFWSPTYGQKEPAIRYTVSEKGKQLLVCHVIYIFDGKQPPPVTSAWESTPVIGQTVRIRLQLGDSRRIIRLEPKW